MICSFLNFYGQCNKCKKVFIDKLGDEFFDDEDDLIELMIANKWKVEDVEHTYCSECKNTVEKQ